jgi:hypothetical protein
MDGLFVFDAIKELFPNSSALFFMYPAIIFYGSIVASPPTMG